MRNRPPRGYRFVTDEDNTRDLRAEGLLESFCECGHVRSEHEGHDGGGRCEICDCNLFVHQCELVTLDTAATPVVFQPATPQPAA